MATFVGYIDECETGDHRCLALSNCTNVIGSYTCSCDSGYYWHQASASCTADACQSNPCQLDWDCHLLDAGASYVCSPKDGSLRTDDDDENHWKRAVIIVSCVLGALCLILLIVVICLAIRRKRALEMDAYSNSRYNDVAANPRQQGYNKRGSATEMSEQRSRRNVYEAPGRNGDYTQAYDNRSFRSDQL
ncbi:nidogen-2 [Elysia marginata]|uniref:Nidogen-2 n=1 Tax=Elysia marginata TaxID=1093978 RepID=A0AAV4JKX8_9GAST|nr:nidogen-2 [Elysia marginata]